VVDAVVVGSGTILADDAWLTARPDGALARRQPLRVVLDGRGRTPASARIFDASAATLVITTAHGAEQLPDGVEFAVVRPGKGGPRPDGAGGAPRGERNSIETLGVNLDDVFEVLLRRGIHSVLVEGGAAVATAIIDHGICDRLELHLAPLLLGDSATALYTGGPSTLEQAERFVLETVERIDNDIIVALRPGRG
jgi:diaminohydroxyphosphoribosylaminopyrimidine deaminase/5-amino-6-(5-phosphoribosylamino)uracil reductase